MSMRPIEGQPGMFQDTDTGHVLHAKDFKLFEKTWQIPRGRSLSFVTPEHETWVTDRWSILLHPWHEVIDPSLTVSLDVQHKVLAKDIPLFRLAEPLHRSEKSDLEKRLEKVEKALQMPVRPPVWRLSTTIYPMSLVRLHIDGSSDALGQLQEMTKHFLLSLHGVCRVRMH